MDFLNSLLGGKGALIRVDNITHVVKHIFDGVSASPGMSTSIALKREFKSTLPQPFSDCVVDQGKYNFFDTSSDLFNKIKSSPYDYTQSFCLQQCIQQYLNEKCSCGFAPFWTREIFPNVCDNLDKIWCTFKAFLNDYIPNDYSTKYCLPKCPLECNSTEFSYALTSQAVVGTLFAALVKSRPVYASDFTTTTPINDVTSSNKFVELNLYYDSLTYTTSTDSPSMDIAAFLANVGGTLCLLLGISLLSVCELIHVIIESGMRVRHRFKNSQKTATKA
jgi:hypothetical protein